MEKKKTVYQLIHFYRAHRRAKDLNIIIAASNSKKRRSEEERLPSFVHSLFIIPGCCFFHASFKNKGRKLMHRFPSCGACVWKQQSDVNSVHFSFTSSIVTFDLTDLEVNMTKGPVSSTSSHLLVFKCSCLRMNEWIND